MEAVGQRPRLFRKRRMIPVQMLVHIIVHLPVNRKIRRCDEILLRQRHPQTERAEIRRHIPVIRRINFGKELPEKFPVRFPVLHAVWMLFGKLPLKILPDLRRSPHGNDVERRVFVDDAQIQQCRFLHERQSGIRVAVGQEISGKRLQIPVHLRKKHHSQLVIPCIFHQRKFILLRLPRNEQVNRYINALFLQSGNKILHPVKLDRIRLHTVFTFRRQQSIVEMMQTNHIAAHPGKPVRQYIRLLMGGETGGKTEIGTVKAYRSGLFLKREMSVFSGQEPVFTRRSVQQKREVQRRVFFHGAIVGKASPVFIFPEDRLFLMDNDLPLPGGRRNSRDHPESTQTGSAEQDMPDGAAPQSKRTGIQPHPRAFIASGPGDSGIAQISGLPPVPNVFFRSHRKLLL